MLRQRNNSTFAFGSVVRVRGPYLHKQSTRTGRSSKRQETWHPDPCNSGIFRSCSSLTRRVLALAVSGLQN